MNLNNKHICVLWAVVAPYGEGFVRIINALSRRMSELYSTKFFVILPDQNRLKWHTELEQLCDVYYTQNPYKKCSEEIAKKLIDWKIDIVWSHFEAYDIPSAKAIRLSGRNIRKIWHLHDYQSLDKTGLNFKFFRKLGTHIRFLIHYGYYGHNTYLIGVSAEIVDFISHYSKRKLSFPRKKAYSELIEQSYENAKQLYWPIDMRRLSKGYVRPNGVFTFLSFGGESYMKGIPCLFDAANILHKKGIKFCIVITKGYTTEKLLKERYDNELPEWLKVVPQTEDIASLFDISNCYVSASLKETMSLAIAEASIYGLPIIQSDILGTMWNADTPSCTLFRLNDAKDLSEKMISVMNEDMVSLREKCLESSEINAKRLSLENWCEEIISVFNKI